MGLFSSKNDSKANVGDNTTGNAGGRHNKSGGRDKSGGLLGGKHRMPEPRDPRPAGAQRGVAARDNQGRLNFGDGLRRAR